MIQVNQLSKASIHDKQASTHKKQQHANNQESFLYEGFTGIHLSCSGAKIVPLIFYLLRSIGLDIL
jgi:hypothetical protein